MSFTTSEKIRAELSKLAVYHCKRTGNWSRAYELARKELKRMVDREYEVVWNELKIDEKKFIENEFFTE